MGLNKGNLMLTEVAPTVWAVVVNGRTVASNLPSRTLAEAAVMNLSPDQRASAQIVPMTQQGQSILLG